MKTSMEQIASWGFHDLQQVVAIDSASDDASPSVPSTEGQRQLSSALGAHFARLGFASEQDASANLIVRIPPHEGAEAAPPVALMVHMDTAHGTTAVPQLHVRERWDGSRVPYPKNADIHVDVDAYPMLRAFVGDDLIYGDGAFPYGLDDKLGMAELMGLGRVLAAEPRLPHGELFLVFRPDEEIGRMAAVEGLADALAQRGVRFGYTVDGLAPFEINVENFDAARVRVRVPGAAVSVPPGARVLRVDITGVNTHGATAKSEGYLNATVVFARALRELDAERVVPLSFASDGLLECNAVAELMLVAAPMNNPADASFDELEQRVRLAFAREVREAHRRGAGVRFSAVAAPTAATDAARRAWRFLDVLLRSAGPTPLLSEDSDGTEGYTNPHRAILDDGTLVVDVRLRDFTRAAVARRAAHVQACARTVGLEASVHEQYINMGPALARFPAVPRLAEEAARDVGVASARTPIRGGTGVDPFLARGIPVANLGTGYFAPESEKELTSRQNIARHVQWLVALVARVAAER